MNLEMDPDIVIKRLKQENQDLKHEIRHDSSSFIFLNTPQEISKMECIHNRALCFMPNS